MSGLILLLGFVLTVMLLPRLLRWWFARRVERYRKSMDDYLRQATGQYGDYADRDRADSRSGNIDEEIIVEDADFETLPGERETVEPTATANDNEYYPGDEIVDAEFEQIK